MKPYPLILVFLLAFFSSANAFYITHKTAYKFGVSLGVQVAKNHGLTKLEKVLLCKNIIEESGLVSYENREEVLPSAKDGCIDRISNNEKKY